MQCMMERMYPPAYIQVSVHLYVFVSKYMRVKKKKGSSWMLKSVRFWFARGCGG